VPAAAIRSFRLNEAFWQLRCHNGQVVTLVLSAMRREARRSFLYLPEIELSQAGTATKEVDVLALVDGALMIAEAKSNATISKAELGWYRTIAARTRARRLILATSDNSRPLCRALECTACATQGGEHHRDYAWDAGTRTRIADTRAKLVNRGIEVRTLCYESLIASRADARDELSMFKA
jgi:hypothetical protein